MDDIACLTLIFPRAIEEFLVDFLLQRDAYGFTSCACEGHGQHTSRATTTIEKVRGRAHRTEMKIVLSLSDARALLLDLRRALPEADLVYWVTPVMEHGSFL